MEVAYVLRSIFMAIKQMQRIFLIHQKSKLCLLAYILLSLQMDSYKLSVFNGRREKELFSLKL